MGRWWLGWTLGDFGEPMKPQLVMIVTVTDQGFVAHRILLGSMPNPKTPNATVVVGPCTQHLDNRHEQPLSKITQENS